MRMRVLAVVGVMLVAATVRAAGAQAPGTAPKATLLVTDVPLQVALEQACASAGIKCSMAPEVKLPSQKVSTNYRNKPLDEVVGGLLRLVPVPGLVYSVKSDTVLFTQRKVSTAQLELPINGHPTSDPVLTRGPVRLRITLLALNPPDRVEVEYQATWSNEFVMDAQSLNNSLRPLLKLRSGRIIPLGGSLHGGPLPNDQPDNAGGSRAWSFQLKGAGAEKTANDPPAALVWNLAWWPR